MSRKENLTGVAAILVKEWNEIPPESCSSLFAKHADELQHHPDIHYRFHGALGWLKASLAQGDGITAARFVDLAQSALLVKPAGVLRTIATEQLIEAVLDSTTRLDEERIRRLLAEDQASESCLAEESRVRGSVCRILLGDDIRDVLRNGCQLSEQVYLRIIATIVPIRARAIGPDAAIAEWLRAWQSSHGQLPTGVLLRLLPVAVQAEPETFVSFRSALEDYTKQTVGTLRFWQDWSSAIRDVSELYNYQTLTLVREWVIGFQPWVFPAGIGTVAVLHSIKALMSLGVDVVPDDMLDPNVHFPEVIASGLLGVVAGFMWRGDWQSAETYLRCSKIDIGVERILEILLVSARRKAFENFNNSEERILGAVHALLAISATVIDRRTRHQT